MPGKENPSFILFIKCLFDWLIWSYWKYSNNFSLILTCLPSKQLEQTTDEVLVITVSSSSSGIILISMGNCGSCGLGELPAKPQLSHLPCAFGCRDWEPTASGWPWRALWRRGTVSGCRTLSCWKTSPAKLHSLRTWGNASRRTWSMWVAQGQSAGCPSVTCSEFAAGTNPALLCSGVWRWWCQLPQAMGACAWTGLGCCHLMGVGTHCSAPVEIWWHLQHWKSNSHHILPSPEFTHFHQPQTWTQS